MPAKVVDASALAAVIFSEPEARRLRPALERISCFLHNSCASRLPTFAGRSSGSIPTDATLSWRRRDARSDGCILPLAGPRARRRVGDSRRRPGRAVRLKPRQDHPARPAHSRRGRGPAGRGTVRSQDRPCGPQIPERRLPAQRQADRRGRHGSVTLMDLRRAGEQAAWNGHDPLPGPGNGESHFPALLRAGGNGESRLPGLVGIEEGRESLFPPLIRVGENRENLFPRLVCDGEDRENLFPRLV